MPQCRQDSYSHFSSVVCLTLSYTRNCEQRTEWSQQSNKQNYENLPSREATVNSAQKNRALTL